MCTFARKFKDMDQEKWHWQEPLTAWRGVGLYHITLVVPTREDLLGNLVIPDNDPALAKVDVLPLGRALINALWNMPQNHPDIQVLHYCLMPDHLHMIWYVRRSMKKESIKTAVQGFWQGIKQIGRFHTYKNSSNYTDCQSVSPTSLRASLGDKAYYALSPIFTEKPFIRPMARYNQLPATIDYLDMNPQRLATKRLKPGFFCVQPNVEINGRTYAAVGNSKLLCEALRTPVHVRHTMTEAARLGNPQPLNDYIASCLAAARQGSVMVSPFISSWEKDILHTLLNEQRPIIYLADNGFKDYFKPSALLFDAVAAGRLLILSPWPYDASKRRVSRADCIALNNIAEEICTR